MSESTAEPPQKKAKQSSSTASRSQQLPSLLHQLNRGRPLDLTVIAAIKAAETCGCKSTCNPHAETLHSTLDKLFADHVGKSREIVIGNAIRHAKEEAEREEWIYGKNARGTAYGDERKKWLDYPDFCLMEGPRTDGEVWLSLFLEKEQAEVRLKGTMPKNCPINSPNGLKERMRTEFDATEDIILKCLKMEAWHLSTVDLLWNILSYIRNEASMVPLSDLLRFSVLYGLDGVMKDIFHGHYGDVGDLSIDSLLPLDDNPLEGPQRRMYFERRRMFMPAYAMGAIIGHTNITLTALQDLGGKLDLQYGIQLKAHDDKQFFGKYSLPAEVFHWIFQKNMPEMIKCFVNECGFQFRWIHHERHMPKIFSRIFDEEHREDFPKWAGDVDEEDLMWDSPDIRRQIRAEASYKVQMEMLDLLIELGFPFDLFFPIDPPLEREEEIRKEKKPGTPMMSCPIRRHFLNNMSKEERHARAMVSEACNAYNSMQVMQDIDPETLTLCDYYRKLKNQWKGQKSVQVSRLDEFEAFDSRWRKKRRECDREEGNGSD